MQGSMRQEDSLEVMNKQWQSQEEWVSALVSEIGGKPNRCAGGRRR
jgi:hypothetical protein